VAKAQRNFWNECYDGQAQRTLPPDDFRKSFCHFCRNVECSLALAGKTQWQARMDSQVDRLLENPEFADLNDPKYRFIRGIDFPDMLRQAMALEISAQRGDWEVPSQGDAMQLAATGQVVMPEPEPPPVETPEPEEPDTPDEPADEGLQQRILWEGNIKGEKGKKGEKGQTYRVLLMALPNAEPTWSCTCKSFEYQRDGDGLCKHIRMVLDQIAPRMQVAEDPEPEPQPLPPAAPPEPPPPVQRAAPVPTPRNAVAEPGPRATPFIPRMVNTPSPSEGLMIGGAAAPEPTAPTPAHDPWAGPVAKPDNIVPVGGKVRMGLTGKTKKDS
jgi:hypothetical protein